jgi:hypothetical protein
LVYLAEGYVVPSGKRNHHNDDTLLYFSELLVSRMRACLERKERGELHQCVTDGFLARLDGAASDEYRFVSVPSDIWEQIQPGIQALASSVGVTVTFPRAYWTAADNTMVRFHVERRRGEDDPQRPQRPAPQKRTPREISLPLAGRVYVETDPGAGRPVP